MVRSGLTCDSENEKGYKGMKKEVGSVEAGKVDKLKNLSNQRDVCVPISEVIS